MDDSRTPPAADAAPDAAPADAAPKRVFAFTALARRARHDGWTPDKQVDFIDALAECGCVTEACKRVGMTPSSAYALRREVEAMSFREAWRAALDHAVERLSDAVFSRAINGVARPVFFQGEQIGERRYYDERLAMFLLRYRDPLHYGKGRDEPVDGALPAGAAYRLYRHRSQTEEDAFAAVVGNGADDAEPDTGEGETGSDVP